MQQNGNGLNSIVPNLLSPVVMTVPVAGGFVGLGSLALLDGESLFAECMVVSADGRLALLLATLTMISAVAIKTRPMKRIPHLPKAAFRGALLLFCPWFLLLSDRFMSSLILSHGPYLELHCKAV